MLACRSKTLSFSALPAIFIEGFLSSRPQWCQVGLQPLKLVSQSFFWIWWQEKVSVCVCARMSLTVGVGNKGQSFLSCSIGSWSTLHHQVNGCWMGSKVVRMVLLSSHTLITDSRPCSIGVVNSACVLVSKLVKRNKLPENPAPLCVPAPSHCHRHTTFTEPPHN